MERRNDGDVQRNPEITLRRIVEGDGTESTDMRVRCPSCGRGMTFGEAAIREFFTLPLGGRRPVANREDAIRMVRQLGRGRPARDGRDREAEIPRAAGRTTLAELMVRQLVFVRPETSLQTLRALLIEHNISGVPVIDDRGNLVGVVSKTDLVRERDAMVDDAALARDEESALEPGFHVEAIPQATVGEIMTPFVFVLPTSTSVAQAAALMAYEGVHRVVVVSGDGAVAGLVSALDILGWLSRESGYAVPRYTQQQQPR